MRRPSLAVLVAALALAGAAAAAPVSLPVDHSMRLSVAGSASAVVVGNPGIADVQVVDSHTIFLSGRSLGSTNVAVLDALGRTIYSADVEVAAPVQGHVAVFHGAQRNDFSCNPACGSAMGRSGGGAGVYNGAAGGAASAAAQMPAMMGANAVAPVIAPR